MSNPSAMIESLEFNAKKFPSVVANDGSVASLPDAKQWLAENLDALKKELEATGAILFRGFPVSDVEGYDDFFATFGYDNFTYKESLSNAVRVNHTKVVFTANEAPKDVEIFMHNEMAQTPIYPDIISLFCERSADEGGATVICRSDFIYDQLLAEFPELTKKIEEVGVKYTTHMPAEDSPDSGQGRSWRGTLSVDTVEQAEEKLVGLGYSWTWGEDGSLSVQTPALPAVRVFSGTRKVFFNQIIAAYMGWHGARENPGSVLCFGDDSEIPREYLDAIVSIAEKLAYDLNWQDGDVAIVNNSLAMHGRRPYSGDRKRRVFVALGLES